MIAEEETRHTEKTATEKGHNGPSNHVYHSNPISRVVFPGLDGLSLAL